MKVILLTITYMDKALTLKFYEPKSKRIILMNDRTKYKASCYMLPEDADKIKEMVGIMNVENIPRFNVIKDKEVIMSKVTCTDPLVINGLDESLNKLHKVWESDIKYQHNYIYDNNLIIGQWYDLDTKGNLTIIEHKDTNFDLSKIDMSSVVNESAFNRQLIRWSRLLSQPIPNIRRMAFDIEVETSQGKLPDAYTATERVTGISFESEDLHKVFILNRKNIEMGEIDKDKNYDVVFYDSEKEMLEDSFKLIEQYPMILTYNGDIFDMPYLYHRAIVLGIESTPFKMLKRNATLTHGIHVDLYGVFSNRSLKLYAFNGKYVENGLGAVTQAMLGETKTEYDGALDQIPINLLAKYCYNDSRLTYKLSTYDNNLVMNLLIILSRIANLPIDDISRQSISNWIKSLFYYIHRLNNEIIPQQSDFPDIKASTKADIKDKKYKGAIVLDQKKGIHFDVTVLDFASLYPSIIKTKNISYETVCCPHESCKSNKIPYTEHWSCKKKQGIVSLLIGSLKELRVGYYKKLAKTAKTDEEKNINDTIAQALKVFLNASYGVIGFESFPLFFLPTAEAVTAIGRDIISQTVKAAEDISLPVLAGDTDSIFTHNPTKDQIDHLIEFCRKNYAIDLEVDKEYRYLMLSGRKKNYFGVKKNGDLDIKGLSGKKSNTPPFVKDLFYKILDKLKMINQPEDFVPTKISVEKDIKDVIDNFDTIPIQGFTFKVMINKEPYEYKVKPPVLKAADQLHKEKGILPEKGTFVEYIKTWKKPHVKPIELASLDDIDKEKYKESLETVMEQITDPMDIDMDILMGRGKMTVIDDFW